MSDLNEQFGQKLFDTIKHGFKNLPDEIYEYDFQLIQDEEKLFFKVEQKNYLCINKSLVKEFYIYWRKRFFQHDEQTVDIVSLMVLLVNANFASAWSRRKGLIVKALNEVENLDLVFKIELGINQLILMKNFKCEQAFVVKK